jgi:hypothetical protein
MRHLITIGHVKIEFANRGYELISTEYINQKEKLKYFCTLHKEKGIQEVDYDHFHYRGQGCRYCANNKISLSRQKEIDEKEFEQIANIKGFIYVGYCRHDENIWIKYICKNHVKYGIQEMTYTAMKNNKNGCRRCIERNLSQEDFLIKAQQANPNTEILEPYVNYDTKIKCRCKIHNIIYYKSPGNILSNKGCKKCWADKNRLYIFKSDEEFKNEMYKINPKIEIISKYNDYNDEINCRCGVCKNEWVTTPQKLLFDKSHCPKCKMYKGEFKIGNLLDNWGYEYITQYRISDCKDILPLPFDFYIPKFNILIEYDGILHFKPQRLSKMSKNSAQKAYEIIVKHDYIKDIFCKNNNLPLTRISYLDDEDNNVEYYLFDELVKYGAIEEIKAS